MPKGYSDLESYLGLDSANLAGSLLHCPSCGKEHSVPIGIIEAGTNLARELPDVAESILGHAPRKSALIYDRAIEEIIRASLIDKIASMRPAIVALSEPSGHLDSTDILGDEVAKALDPDVEIIIGAGSGVIADLTKWIATKVKKPFILYATAASMNAHASITATMTIGGVKTSVWLDPASAVIFDLDVIAKAPKPMRLAGLGDLVARSICNADWKLSQLLRDKSFCPVPYALTASGEEHYLKEAKGIGSGDIEATGILAEATLVSAISMTMMGGETSPSSGCEHVFSHYWDLQVELEGAQKNLHGIQVGIGTILSYALWETMRELDIDSIDPQALLRHRPSFETICAESHAKFGPKAHLFDEALKAKWVEDDKFVARVSSIAENWDDMWGELSSYIGDYKEIRKALKDAGFELSLDSIGRTRKQAIDALVFGARYRSRYTMLDLAWELGVLPGAAENILEKSGLDKA